MHLIVGLGNPGKEYTYTRHNAGFLALDAIANEIGITGEKGKYQCQARVYKARYKNNNILLAKPETYMNNSGLAVAELCNYYDIDVKRELTVIYDDIDLPLGTIRLRQRGSAGTHNGMRSIIRLLGDDNFARVRIGIGKNPEYMKLADYVLSKFSKDEEELFLESLKNGASATLELIDSGILAAQEKYNKKSN